jgi:hypothetical protein
MVNSVSVGVGVFLLIIAVGVILFQKQLVRITVFLTTAAHDFATEYNSAYNEDDEGEGGAEGVAGTHDNHKEASKPTNKKVK